LVEGAPGLGRIGGRRDGMRALVVSRGAEAGGFQVVSRGIPEIPETARGFSACHG